MTAAVAAAVMAVAAAAVIAAGVPLAMGMVSADSVGVEGQIAGQIGCNSGISAANHAGQRDNASLHQRSAGAAANAAADKNIHAGSREELGQRTVAAALGGNDQRVDDLLALHIVDLKLLSVAKMLEHLGVAAVIGNCNSHGNLSLV